MAFGRTLQAKCTRAGLTGCFPLDGEASGERPADETPQQVADAIYRANVMLLDSVQAIVADISPFRGPNMDPGTAWEIGYGIAKGLPVFAWSDDFSTLFERTRRHVSAAPSPQRRHDGNGWLIEDFLLVENLMIARSVTSLHRCDDEAIEACAAALRGKR